MDNDPVLDNDETSDIDDPSIPALFILGMTIVATRLETSQLLTHYLF